VNLCSCNSPYNLNCHVGAMLVFRMLYRITQSSDAHRAESLSVMDHEQTMGLTVVVVVVVVVVVLLVVVVVVVHSLIVQQTKRC